MHVCMVLYVNECMFSGLMSLYISRLVYVGLIEDKLVNVFMLMKDPVRLIELFFNRLVDSVVQRKKKHDAVSCISNLQQKICFAEKLIAFRSFLLT